MTGLVTGLWWGWQVPDDVFSVLGRGIVQSAIQSMIFIICFGAQTEVKGNYIVEILYVYYI